MCWRLAQPWPLSKGEGQAKQKLNTRQKKNTKILLANFFFCGTNSRKKHENIEQLKNAEKKIINIRLGNA